MASVHIYIAFFAKQILEIRTKGYDFWNNDHRKCRKKIVAVLDEKALFLF